MSVAPGAGGVPGVGAASASVTLSSTRLRLRFTVAQPGRFPTSAVSVSRNVPSSSRETTWARRIAIVGLIDPTIVLSPGTGARAHHDDRVIGPSAAGRSRGRGVEQRRVDRSPVGVAGFAVGRQPHRPGPRLVVEAIVTPARCPGPRAARDRAGCRRWPTAFRRAPRSERPAARRTVARASRRSTRQSLPVGRRRASSPACVHLARRRRQSATSSANGATIAAAVSAVSGPSHSPTSSHAA